MKKIVLGVFGVAALSCSAFGASATFFCQPTAITNSNTNGSALNFLNGSGTGSFACSDAGISGAFTLSSVSVSLFTDYTFGGGTASDPNDNSAGFTFSNAATTWAAAQPGAFTSTMNLGTGVTLFAIGNQLRQAETFTNTKTGGLGGTAYVIPTTDTMSGALLGSFTIGATGFLDAGSITDVSDAHVSVTFNYTPVTTSSPEPVSMILFGSGLLAVSLIGRKKLARKR